MIVDLLGVLSNKNTMWLIESKHQRPELSVDSDSGQALEALLRPALAAGFRNAGMTEDFAAGTFTTC